MQIKEKLGSYLQLSKSYINPFTVAGLVFVIWVVASRTGYIPNGQRQISNRNYNGGGDDEENENDEKQSWNFSQAILVATTVVASYYLLRYMNPSGAVQTANGFQLPEGASILMPGDLSKGGASSSSAGAGQQSSSTASLLTGTPPF